MENNALQLWLAHQSSSGALAAASQETGIQPANITVHSAYMGGGFGRNGELDIVLRACAVAKAMPGMPIMTMYTREEDMLKSVYRPASTSTFQAALNPAGRIAAWTHKIVSQSPMKDAMARAIPPMEMPGMEAGLTDGARFLPYHMPHRKVEMSTLDLPIPVGPMRGVDHVTNAYFTECFMDECAKAAGIDPLLFRQQHLKDHPSYLAVLERLAQRSNWYQA
ncbi:MAG: molybdopterin cofactor-binding domain-containing protein, partial [Bacteroidota bacterium]